MVVRAIKTRTLRPPQDDLFGAFREAVERVEERSVVVITSKVVAIHQGRCVLRQGMDERALIIEEADAYLEGDLTRHRPMMLTIKENLLIPKAGIDTSNANGYFVLWPQKVDEFAEDFRRWIQEQYSVSEVGVLIVDSGILPLRWGTVGVSLGHAGFCPLKDYRDTRDIFGKKSLKVVTANVADSLASAANIVMGEGSETTPLALISDVPFVTFGSCPEGLPPLKADPAEDLYTPLIEGALWMSKDGET